MGIQKNILVDGKEVPFKASAAVPRLYRLKFGRDLFQDFSTLQKSVEENENTEEVFRLGIDSLEIFESLAYIMAKHADSSVPDSPGEWLEQFQIFSIYRILPQLLTLWGLNMKTKAIIKKNNAPLTEP
ncbi:MAG: hypothetical protein Q4D37_06930 [Oscillospiraceae bacterium]|nr:hypothetical protein [Oscillospiraceae bacterium]